MYLRTEILKEKKLLGKNIEMSFAENKTFELWRSFMPIKNKIEKITNQYLYSVEEYGEDFFKQFNPLRTFKKWAAVEVDAFSENSDFEELLIPTGLYAVFLHKGPASEGPKTYNYIFNEWIPKSEYEIDLRSHFALMGEKYKNDSPDSEEEIWIPIKKK